MARAKALHSRADHVKAVMATDVKSSLAFVLLMENATPTVIYDRQNHARQVTVKVCVTCVSNQG